MFSEMNQNVIYFKIRDIMKLCQQMQFIELFELIKQHNNKQVFSVFQVCKRKTLTIIEV